VGTYGLLPTRFLVDGVERDGLAGVDFCVRPELRGLGLGRRLSDAFLGTPGSTVRLITSPTAATVALMRERGACVVDGAAERALFARPGPFGRPARAAADDGLELAGETDFGPEFSDFARALGRHHRVQVLRDAAYLRWRYVEDPFLRHVVLAARERGRLAGFCVLTLAQSEAQGFLAEWAVAPDDRRTAAALLAAAEDAAAERGLAALAVFERRPRLRTLLAERGYATVEHGVPSATLLLTDRPSTAEEWLLCPGDGDVLFRIGGD
jgi:GNAT superfamily N-acetyltransferase